MPNPAQTAPLFDALGASRTLEAMEIFNALCIAFVLSMVIANVYRWTHQGFSYQRSFIHTLVLVCIVICIMILRCRRFPSSRRRSPRLSDCSPANRELDFG